MLNSQLKMIAVLCTLLLLFCSQSSYNTTPNDTTKPVFSKPNNDTVAIAIGTNFTKSLDSIKTSVNAIDNIEGDISNKIDVNTTSVSHVIPGVYPVIYTVSDRYGNSASIIRYVKVYTLDTVPPVISFGKDTVSLNVGEPYIDQIATAFDSIDGNVSVISSGKVDTSKAAIYLINYTAKDKSNNSITKIKTVIVKIKTEIDKTKPQLSLIGDTMMCVASFTLYIEPGYMAVDNNDGIITNKVIVDYAQFKTGAQTGSYLITYTIHDSAGNSSSKTRYVCLNCSSLDDDGDRVPNVYEDDDHDGTLNIDDPDSKSPIVDTIKPFFSKPGNDTVLIALGGGAVFDKNVADFKASVKATDNLEGDISESIFINESVSSLVARVNPVVFTVSDKDGNTTSITRYIKTYMPIAEDKTPPVVSFGNDTVFLMVGDHYIEQTATAFDLFEGRNVPVTSTGKVDTAKAGTYFVVYTAKDNSNNSISKTKTVIVEAGTADVDRIIPELILKGNDSMTVATFAQFEEPGFTATDNHDGVITSKVVKDYGQFKAGAAAGSYILKYTVRDSAGNSVTKTRFLCLNCGSIDVLKPTLSVAGGDTVYSILIRGKTRVVTAIDLTDGILTDSIKRTGNFDSTKSGVYTLTYTVSDKAENRATIRVTITIATIIVDKDTTKPVITLKGKNPDTVAVDSVGTYVDLGSSARDSGKTIAVPIVSGSVDLKIIGSYTLAYTATDAAGNITTATRIVVVKEVSKDLLIKYAVPSASPLAAMLSTKFTTYTFEGTPTITIDGFTSLDFNWGGSQMYSFMISTSGPPYLKDLITSSIFTLSTANPAITIANLTEPNLSGLNGSYWVTKNGLNLIWVKKDGSFAIIWTP